jgi:hypothetical protein
VLFNFFTVLVGINCSSIKNRTATAAKPVNFLAGSRGMIGLFTFFAFLCGKVEESPWIFLAGDLMLWSSF